MRYTAGEKMEIIRLVEESELTITETLKQLDVSKSSFYEWYGRYEAEGYDGLLARKPNARKFWNKIPEREKDHVVEVALEHLEKSPRELACHITDTEEYYLSESSVYRILKSRDLITSPQYIVLSAADKFQHPTRRVHELWQTDFTYVKVVGWGWYYLGSVLDDYSRYIIAWKLFTSMSAGDVTELLDMAVAKAGVEQVTVRHRPRLLSDNGPCYVSGELQQYLEAKGMAHTRGAPYHPMTQGKIERYHRSLKNIIRLQNYYLPGELELEIGRFNDYYNNHRYHESLNNVTPADVYFGRYREIVTRRDRIKKETLKLRRIQNLTPNQLHQPTNRLLTLSESIS
jgi:putative transposase